MNIRVPKSIAFLLIFSVALIATFGIVRVVNKSSFLDYQEGKDAFSIIDTLN